jgi:hypothetical protein
MELNENSSYQEILQEIFKQPTRFHGVAALKITT